MFNYQLNEQIGSTELSSWRYSLQDPWMTVSRVRTEMENQFASKTRRVTLQDTIASLEGSSDIGPVNAEWHFRCFDIVKCPLGHWPYSSV